MSQCIAIWKIIFGNLNFLFLIEHKQRLYIYVYLLKHKVFIKNMSKEQNRRVVKFWGRETRNNY